MDYKKKHRQKKSLKFQTIVEEFNKLPPDPWLIHCEKTKSLKQCVVDAATALKGPSNIKNNKHPHQYRISKANLQSFSKKLSKKEQEIRKCKNFSELHNVVNNCKIKGVAELTVYDAALRIGCKLGIKPNYIYLHRGTKEGASILFNKDFLRFRIKQTKLPTSLEVNNLPKEFGTLEPYQIEQLLCIFKKQLENVVR